jgi:hypothetical protein
MNKQSFYHFLYEESTYKNQINSFETLLIHKKIVGGVLTDKVVCGEATCSIHVARLDTTCPCGQN